MASATQTRKHPAGLPWLFFTEMWERFGFYLMLGILVLYMKDKTTGGLGFDSQTANDIYGTYIAFVYLTPFIGGLLADRLFGYRATIIAGGALMGIGYCLLAIPNTVMFFVALGCIIIGNGLFKPNISTLLGNLYNDPEYKARKDQGYNIFYMGINIGAFVCNFVAAFMRNEWGWGAAFISAGVGMFLGLIIFVLGQNTFRSGDVLKPANKEDMPLSNVFLQVFLPAALFGVGGYFVREKLLPGIALSGTTFGFLFGCIPVVYFYLRTYLKASEEDKKPIGSLLSIFGVVIVFWMVFHQNGNVLTAWAEEDTRREAPAGAAGFLGKIGLLEEVSNDTIYSIKSDKEHKFYLKGEPHTPVLTSDPMVIPLAEEEDRPSFTPVYSFQGTDTLREGYVSSYLYNLPREEWPAEGVKMPTFNTELFQSLNPLFVVLLTGLVLGFFAFLRKRGMEPSTPGKIALGLFITGLSTIVMIIAVSVSHNGAEKVSWLWLGGTYAVITVGELCLSPMGLSLVSKLSPARLTAVMMGGWFLSTSIGNKLAGVMGGLETAFEDKSVIFYINLGGAMLSALLLWLMVKKISAVVKDKTGSN